MRRGLQALPRWRSETALWAVTVFNSAAVIGMLRRTGMARAILVAVRARLEPSGVQTGKPLTRFRGSRVARADTRALQGSQTVPRCVTLLVRPRCVASFRILHHVEGLRRAEASPLAWRYIICGQKGDAARLAGDVGLDNGSICVDSGWMRSLVDEQGPIAIYTAADGRVAHWAAVRDDTSLERFVEDHPDQGFRRWYIRARDRAPSLVTT